MRAALIFILCHAVLCSQTLFAFNDKVTHPHLTDSAIKKANLDEFLKESLDWEEGINTVLEQKTVVKWLESGAELEDHPACRASNHFHDPLMGDWTMSGLTDTHWLVNLWCYGFGFGQYPPDEINSNITWATGHTSPSEKENTGVRQFNEWDWDSAREYYYIYLTGKDFPGREIAPDDHSRNKYMSKCFGALGQVLHLFQDMAVPAHVRNDFSQGHTDVTSDSQSAPWHWIGNGFEAFVKKNDSETWFSESMGGNSNDMSLTNFWDTNTYDGSVPITDENMLGIAEYTNLNFVSAYTIFSKNYPYPNEGSTNIEEYILDNLSSEIVTDGDGVTREVTYFSKTQHGEHIDHFVIPSYLSKEMVGIEGGIERTYRLDERCFSDYAALLIPRAVGYSAGLLDYFFRGKLQVTALPIFYANSIYAVALHVHNLTPDGETLKNGTFSLIARYTPAGGNPDGSDDIFIQAYDVESGELQYDQGADVQFYLSEPVPVESHESVKCMLVFKGTLGNEENAVVGKSFSLGQIKFNEEWDNGLNGNYQWMHATPDDNPDNGSTSNAIDYGILLKDNIRYAGYRTPRFNSSYIDFTDTDNPNGMPITPDTYLQFKIDDLSINEQPPAPEGHTTAWQYLSLEFNNGLGIQYTQKGQGINWGSDIAYYTFNLGSIIVDNIHGLFQNYGITVPDPLYLKSIELTQQLWDLSEPSTVEHRQHMEVDSIRIVESNVEPE